jgi:Ni/Fe-hydrogenase subunit HybB-like protein
MGYWYLTEMLGFVLLPMILFFLSYRKQNILLIKIAAVVTMIGIIINRLNISVIGFKWDAVHHYYPSWMEITVTLAVIFTELWIFRWVIRRMPVLSDSPALSNEK